MAYLMGIDLGTSSLKTLICDEQGNVAAEASEAYQFDSPHGGYSEQDPEVWWNACVHTIRKCLSVDGIQAEDVRALSFSGQMHGAVLLDGAKRVIRPAILHNDARSSGQVEDLKDLFGTEGVRQLMMNPVYTGFLLPSLLWVRDNEKNNYDRVKTVCLPKDYLKQRLTGDISSDFSDASATLAYDIRRNCWSEEILGKVQIPVSFFPKLYATADAVGKVSAEAAGQTGLSESTIVVAGGGDQVMQGIGNGVVTPGVASSNIGTAGQLSYRSDVPILNPDLTTNTFTSYRPDQWLVMGAIMNAGVTLKWFNSLFESADYDAIEKMVCGVKPGSGGVVFLPYLNGERTPHLNPDLSGVLFGVNLNTGRAELTRAVMEGVTYALNECRLLCESMGLRADEIIASGGGARSRTWLQIQADVFGTPMRVTDTQEQAGLGAAIAAGCGAGIYSSVEEGCAAAVRYKDMIVEPDPENHRIYEEYYQIYKEIFQSSKRELEKVTLLGRRTG